MADFKLPNLGEGVESGEIVGMVVKAKDKIDSNFKNSGIQTKAVCIRSFAWVWIFLGVALLGGCATMPGGVDVAISSYDGSKAIVMQPGWANSGYGLSETLKIGARKNSKMKKDEAVLVVRNDMIKSFSTSRPNFYVKIDNIEFGISPLGDYSNIEISTQSDVAHTTCEYPIKLKLIEEMLKSNDVRFKLLLVDGYVEGDLSKSGPTTAKSGLSDFMDKVSKEF